MDNISSEIYQAVERWYETEKNRKKLAWYRKAIYFLYLTGHYPKELFSKNPPRISREKIRIGNNIIQIIKIEMDARVRKKGKYGRKTFSFPAFLDTQLNKEKTKGIIVEEAMWDIITDSWAYEPYILDMQELGDSAEQMLYQKCRNVKIQAYAKNKVSEIPLKIADLRTLRIYDLLANRLEYLGGNPMAVMNIVGLTNAKWLMDSEVMRMAYSKANMGNTIAIMQKYSNYEV